MKVRTTKLRRGSLLRKSVSRERVFRGILLKWSGQLVIGGLTLLGVAAAHAATFSVTNVNDSGAGSLRQAILDANDNANPTEVDTINFNISASGVPTIKVGSTGLGALPVVTEPVTIDGYTQAGASPNTRLTGDDAVLLIQLNGSAAGTGVDGLTLAASRSTVRGLIINRFSGSGIVAGYGGHHIIAGNFIGTNAFGRTDLGNSGNGVFIADAPDNTVGGTDVAARNIISGNDANGVRIAGSAAISNVVAGNYIGTDEAGSQDVGNSGEGVAIDNTTNNTVGGATAETRNVISGNDLRGVLISGSAAANNVVKGNYIGVDRSGSGALGNAFEGVLLAGAQSNRVGGTSAGVRNVISGNNTHGISIIAGATDNRVQGNYIGTDRTGTTALSNLINGVYIESATNNTIGGTSSGAGNVISGNALHGILIAGSLTTGNVVAGNYIGTDKNGSASVRNILSGVRIDSAPNNIIGGTVAGAGNLICRSIPGVFISGPAATGNKVQGNFIGTDKTGTGGIAALGNFTEGVRIENAGQNTVGGTSEEARNIISNNAHGVLIFGDLAVGNRVEGNYLGTDVTGTQDLGNIFEGVRIVVNAANNTVARNVISGNGGGIALVAGPTNTLIRGNYIGTDKSGSAPLPNSDAGVVCDDASNNIVGLAPDGTGQANRIAFNTGDGVTVFSGAHNSIRGNSIFANGGLGIDLNNDGVTNNDSQDPDVGANLLQNYPILNTVVIEGGNTKISGKINSTPNTTFILDFYRSPNTDGSSHGEGKVHMGHTNVTTSASGGKVFVFTLTGSFANQFFAATATNKATGDTSEFSLSRGLGTPYISGRVTTSAGAGVAGVTITRLNTGTGTQVQTTTDNSGYYAFSEVAAGSYNISASKTGSTFTYTGATPMPLTVNTSTNFSAINFQSTSSTTSAMADSKQRI